MARLQETQIDPVLAARIQQSQSFIEEGTGAPGTTSRVPSAAAMGVLVERLEAIQMHALSLSDRAQEDVAEFSALLRSHAVDGRVGALEARMGDYLSGSADLGQRLAQVAPSLSLSPFSHSLTLSLSLYTSDMRNAPPSLTLSTPLSSLQHPPHAIGHRWRASGENMFDPTQRVPLAAAAASAAAAAVVVVAAARRRW